MAGEHYFSEHPESALTKNIREVQLRGHTVSVITASGTFSPGGLDRGTQVLLKYAPVPPNKGTFLDIGCGWGAISLALALESPEAAIYGVDVNERARQSARDNCEHLGIRNVTICAPEEVPEGLAFDLVWSNPPIRVGKTQLHNILTLWLNRLAPHGEAYLVVAKKLGADSLQEWLNGGEAGAFVCDRMETSAGFRVLRVTRA